MNNTDSKTIQWLRFPLACLIVLLHSQIPDVDSKPLLVSNGFAYALKILLSEGICRIAVPCFFFISGYLFFVHLERWDNQIWLGKLKRRVQTLLIPYIMWNLVGIAYLCISPYFGSVIESPSSMLSILQERGWLRIFWDSNRIMEKWNPAPVNIIGVTMHTGMPVDSPLWFIRELMVMNLFSPLIYYLVKKTKRCGLCILGILFLLNIWIPLEGFSIIGVFFYSFGAYFSIISKEIVCSFQKIKPLIYYISAAFLFCVLATFGRHWSAQYFLRCFQIVGVISIFNIASSMVNKRERRNMSLLDSSFFIYASHIFFISGITFLISRVIPGTSQIILALKYIVAPALTIAVCEGIYLIMKKVCPGLLALICGNRNTATLPPSDSN